jgi:hypothetical protein
MGAKGVDFSLYPFGIVAALSAPVAKLLIFFGHERVAVGAVLKVVSSLRRVPLPVLFKGRANSLGPHSAISRHCFPLFVFAVLGPTSTAPALPTVARPCRSPDEPIYTTILV